MNSVLFRKHRVFIFTLNVFECLNLKLNESNDMVATIKTPEK